MREEEDAVKALIGDISHQVRTPLANIRLYTQLLAEQPLNERGRTCVGALDAQTEKLRTLLEALVKTYAEEVATTPVKVNLLIREFVESLGGRAR